MSGTKIQYTTYLEPALSARFEDWLRVNDLRPSEGIRDIIRDLLNASNNKTDSAS